MADKVTKDDDKVADKPDPMAVMAESFKDMVSGVKKDIAASIPAPVAAPIVDDSVERKAAAQAKFEASHEKVNELLAAGDGAGAMGTYLEGIIGVQNANAPNPDTNPQVKAGIASARKLSRADHKTVYDKYGAEIEADMAALPADQRINPDSWDAAVGRVKAAHIEDIITDRLAQNAEDIKKAEEDAVANATGPPIAGRGRAPREDHDGVDASNLSEAQLEAADSCGLSPEKYAEACDNYDKHVQKGGSVLFLNEPTKGLKIEPGAF